MIVETVTSGSLIVALSIAFAAGIVAFLSPCVLPLAPGYVSYVTGLTGAELADPTGRRGRVLLGSLLFVLGFSIVFVSYGVAFGSIGSVLLQYQEPINRVLGVIVIVMGLVFLGVIPGMQREWRLHDLGSCRGAAPRHHLWPRLVAVHWPDPHGRPVTCLHRGERDARGRPLDGLLPRPGPAVRGACRGVQPHCGCARLGKAQL